jgi:hypothetical protein
MNVNVSSGAFTLSLGKTSRVFLLVAFVSFQADSLAQTHSIGVIGGSH